MTREERDDAIMFFRKVAEKEIGGAKYSKLAINALEQQPSEDAVNRQKLKEQMIKYGFHAPDMTVTEFVEDLPSVTPQPKTGRWILSGLYWRCSECKEKALLTFDKSEGGCREYEPVRSKHCPSCGAKMEVKE